MFSQPPTLRKIVIVVKISQTNVYMGAFKAMSSTRLHAFAPATLFARNGHKLLAYYGQLSIVDLPRLRVSLQVWVLAYVAVVDYLSVDVTLLLQ